MTSIWPKPWRIMSIMAHQDDFEFNAAGSFAQLRRNLGDQVQFKILTTNRGSSGHHEMSHQQTFERRQKEAAAAAAIIGAEYECLRQLDGSLMADQVFINHNLLGGLWNTIRDFEPHVIFCPPVTRDPLAGIHIDHENTATAVRMLAYQLAVPHAFPTTTGKIKQRVTVPLILNVDDMYASEGHYDIRQDISQVWDTKVAMALCHESQLFEWLPFVKNEPVLGKEEWCQAFLERHVNINRRYKREDDTPSEYFRVTRWGRAPLLGELEQLFPCA